MDAEERFQHGLLPSSLAQPRRLRQRRTGALLLRALAHSVRGRVAERWDGGVFALRPLFRERRAGGVGGGAAERARVSRGEPAREVDRVQVGERLAQRRARGRAQHRVDRLAHGRVALLSVARGARLGGGGRLFRVRLHELEQARPADACVFYRNRWWRMPRVEFCTREWL